MGHLTSRKTRSTEPVHKNVSTTAGPHGITGMAGWQLQEGRSPACCVQAVRATEFMPPPAQHDYGGETVRSAAGRPGGSALCPDVPPAPKELS